MPGFVLHQGATVTCMHAGQAMPSAPFPRVKISTQPVVTSMAQYTIAGCAFNVSGAPCPCTAAQWTVTAMRVRAGGLPVLLNDSVAICVPNGTGVIVGSTQVRVKGM